MRIGLFPLWTGAEIGGIATYDQSLPRALADQGPDNEYHIYSPSREAIELLDLRRNNVKHHLLFPRTRWISVPLSFPIATAFSNLDLVHMTHVPPPISLKPYVMTLHCFSTFAHPEFYPKGLGWRMNVLIKRGIKSARVILCVSEGLRNIAETEWKVRSDRLAVAHHGVSEKFRPIPEDEARARVLRKYGIDRPYLLFVGVIAPRKNTARIVEAYDLYKQSSHSDARLVLAGRKWIAEDVDRIIRQRGLQKDVIHIGHLDNNQLPELYSAAQLLVFPSLWESFGLPVVEAMACGTPVVTSRGSCLPETAGEAALLVDPYSVESIAEGIAKVIEDPDLAKALRQKGIERAKKFSWKSSALRTLAAYGQAMDA
jgi:glycosyltransferase involved in cell wall biosynthesis